MKILVLLLALSLPVVGQTDREKVLNQQLNKALDTIEVQDRLISAQERELQAKNDLIKTQSALIESLELGIESRDAQIAALAKIKCDKTKYFWGIISKTTCR